MRVVVALDSFKGSVSSQQAGKAVREGILAAVPTSMVVVLSVADGGEGTIEAISSAREVTDVVTETVDARLRPIRAPYGVLADAPGPTVVIEAARTIGLGGASPVDQTLPASASSWGLGHQLRHALESGAARILVCLGGTATTDGGTGMLLALGAALTNDTAEPSSGVANPLWDFGALVPTTLPDLARVEVLVDVTNPLLGTSGAAHVFGPQKGASPSQVTHLEDRMARWAAALESTTGRSIATVPGTGAAGGLGAAFLAAGARLVRGFDVVARETGLDTCVRGADLVVTGEGSLDAQTGMGKAPAGVARIGREAGAVVVGLGGRVRRPLGQADDLFDAVFPIHPEPVTLADALDAARTEAGLRATAGEVARIVHALGTRRRPH